MKHYDKSNSQLIAHCFFARGKIQLKNYEKYYRNQEEKQVIDTIEMLADY